MEKQEKYLKKLEDRFNHAQRATAIARGKLRELTVKQDFAKKKKEFAERLIERMNYLRAESDVQVRKQNLQGIYVDDSSKGIINMHLEGIEGIYVDYDVSRRLYLFHLWLVKKHDSVYDVEFQGEMGSMSARTLKKGHKEEEFEDRVWDGLSTWGYLYRNRLMKEDLYHAIMNDPFKSLHSRLIESLKQEDNN